MVMKAEALLELETQQPNKMFRLSLYDNDVAVIAIKVPNKTKNWLDHTFIDDLSEVIQQIDSYQMSGLIFISEDENTFVQGFSLATLETLKEDELRVFTKQTQNLIDSIKQLRIPTVAAIHGTCYGLGLELILACDYRVASTSHQTQFAMPQVRSGILPFGGGCYELTKMIGLKESLPMLMSGHKVTNRWALEHGMVDELVRQPLLKRIALDYIRAVQTVSHHQSLRHKLEVKASKVAWFRNRVLEQAKGKVWQKEFGNYPATDAIAEVLKLCSEVEIKQAEREYFVSLYCSETSKVLRSLVYAQRRMRAQYFDIKAEKEVKQLAIIGGGFMGAGIAFISANRGQLPVRIKDIDPEGVSLALRLCYVLLQREVVSGALPFGKLQQTLHLISGSDRWFGRQSSDVVIEAVYEDLELKQRLIKENEPLFKENTVFASNTSSLSIADVAAQAERPQNVIGMHYFTPVSKLKLVEIVPHDKTSGETIATAVCLAIQQGQVPFLVKDSPGFFINRVRIPYILEAFFCLCEGESIESIDRALQEFGFLEGPITTLDEMGIDLLLKILPNLREQLGERFEVSDKLQILLDDDRKGRKNKRGLYLYHSRKGNRVAVDKSVYHTLGVVLENNLEPEQIARRCLLMMLNEAAYCRQEGLIENIEEANVASVLGMNFPEFRGGIYAYMEEIGYDVILAELELMVEKYGVRFTPAPWLIEQVEYQEKMLRRESDEKKNVSEAFLNQQGN